MALITLLRHAPLPKEYQKRYIGHTDIEIDKTLVDLSKLEFIKERDYDLIFTSDLKRCTQTVDLVNLDYIKDSKLREMRFKPQIEGKSFSELEQLKSYKSEYLNSIFSWHTFISDESIKEYKSRVQSFINEIPKDKDILICSHAGTIGLLYAILNKCSYEENYIKIHYLEKIDIYI